MKELHIMDKASAERSITQPHPYSHLVSIRDMSNRHGESERIRGFANVNNRIELRFDDVSSMNAELLGYIVPTVKDIQHLITWSDNTHDPNGSYLFHCAAGISRSTAAAFIVLCQIMGAGNEQDALARVVATRSVACPNELMVSYGDYLLGRNNEMNNVLEKYTSAKRSLPYGDTY